jgi:hypothetical protein
VSQKRPAHQIRKFCLSLPLLLRVQCVGRQDVVINNSDSYANFTTLELGPGRGT